MALPKSLRRRAPDAWRSHALEIGVYEGSSALVLVDSLPQAARRRGGPALRWHVTTSEEAARTWSESLDLVFIDGDHSESACRLDWGSGSRFVEPGGLVAFHDARGGDPGPTAVVEELFGGDGTPGWRIAAERDAIVAVERLEIR